MSEKETKEDVILSESPTVELNGKKIKLERLSAREIFPVAKKIRSIIRKVSSSLNLENDIDITRLDKLPKGRLIGLLFNAFECAEQEILEITAILLNEDTIEVFEDANQYSLETIPEVLFVFITRHPDYKKLVGVIKKIQGVLG